VLALVLQNTLLIYFMRLSRISKSGDKGSLYISCTAVVMCELIKLIASAIAYYIEQERAVTKSNLLRNEWRSSPSPGLLKEAFGDPKEVAVVLVPSFLYVLQNNLQYLATSHLPAELYQVLIQLKLIVTALLSVSLLGKVLLAGQWLAILVLSAGVAAVQTSFVPSSSSCGLGDCFSPGIGIPAVLLSCVTSGMAGVYNERNVKVDLTALLLMFFL
jgi:UDP-sugar transporter A1/2/3